MSDKIFTVPGIKARRISAPVNTSSVGQTADWSSIGRDIAEAGASIAAGIQAGKTDLQIAEGQIEKGKKPASKLQAKIDKATAEGKDAKAARLTGRKERRDIRDKNRASRITAKNKDKKDALIKSEFFKGQKFNEKQKEKGGTTSDSHLFKPTILEPRGIGEVKPEFSLASPFDMKTFDKFSSIAKNL